VADRRPGLKAFVLPSFPLVNHRFRGPGARRRRWHTGCIEGQRTRLICPGERDARSSRMPTDMVMAMPSHAQLPAAQFPFSMMSFFSVAVFVVLFAVSVLVGFLCSLAERGVGGDCGRSRGHRIGPRRGTGRRELWQESSRWRCWARRLLLSWLPGDVSPRKILPTVRRTCTRNRSVDGQSQKRLRPAATRQGQVGRTTSGSHPGLDPARARDAARPHGGAGGLAHGIDTGRVHPPHTRARPWHRRRGRPAWN
jgi:hypothetical protein